MNIIDITCITILFLSIVICAKKGFLKVGAEVISMLLGVILASWLSSPLAEYTYVKFNIREKLIGLLDKKMAERLVGDLTGEQIGIAFTKAINDFIEKLGFLKNIVANEIFSYNDIVSIIESSDLNSQNRIIDIVINTLEPLLIFFMTSILFLILFFVFRLVISFVSTFIINLISLLPLVGFADFLLGGILGFIYGICWCAIVILILYIMSTTGASDSFVSTKVLDGSIVYKMLINII